MGQVNFKSYLPSKKIYLCWTSTGWDFFPSPEDMNFRLTRPRLTISHSCCMNSKLLSHLFQTMVSKKFPEITILCPAPFPLPFPINRELSVNSAIFKFLLGRRVGYCRVEAIHIYRSQCNPENYNKEGENKHVVTVFTMTTHTFDSNFTLSSAFCCKSSSFSWLKIRTNERIVLV